MSPQAAWFALRDAIEARTEIKKDIGGLRNHQLAGLEKWRRKRRVFNRPTFHEAHHRCHATRSPRHIHVIRTGIFERETNKFTAPLDRRPIVDLVAHESPPEIGRRSSIDLHICRRCSTKNAPSS